MKPSSNLLQQLIWRHKHGDPVGVFSVCSANLLVLETSIKYAARQEIPILIEATCNQVNQFGGYTGMRPNQFADHVWNLVEKYDLPKEYINLGGDHLGPYPWQEEPANAAMQKASQMVYDYVQAGYTKIHLDSSMKCADDAPDSSLDLEISAARAAELCATAEKAALESGEADKITYVIGTEVPLPGGAETDEGELQVTQVEDVQATIETTKEAFYSLGLEEAWERVIAVVVQPGVEYGDSTIFHYKRENAKELSAFITFDDQLIFEAHSTDYQTPGALQQLVEDHFAILKVGPELTFAYREAIFALELIEREIFSGYASTELSNLRRVLDKAMLKNPRHWEKYYQGEKSEQAFARVYSFSDRIRYYWPVPEVQAALSRLLLNLESIDIQAPLISQFLPKQYQKIMRNELQNNPKALLEDAVMDVLEKYSSACQNSI